MRWTKTAALLAVLPVASPAQEEVDLFVESNLIATLYHELGHALIDQMQLPVFGQEEDAADVLSILMIDALFDEETAIAITLDTAYAFSLSAETEDVAYWALHGPDLQRYYTMACLFYGADPDGREDIAAEMGLPEERAITCEEEFQLANDSWGPVLDLLAEGAPGATPLRLTDEGDTADFAYAVLQPEVAALNADFALPDALTIQIAACGEANAWYDPADGSITMCSEYVSYLRELVSE